MMPFFSIIIPTYNRAHIISATIQSVINQQFTDWELIVIDDGGVDNTKEVIEGFNDKRIRYFWKENEERGAARNFGAEKAKGQFLNFFDSDDLMYSSHLQVAYGFLRENSNANVLCFPWDYFNDKNKLLGTRIGFDNDLNKIIKKKNFIHLNGGFIKKSAFELCKFIPDRDFIICEDWYFYLNLSLSNKIYSINTPSFKYIIHENSTMNNMKSKDFLIAIKYFDELRFKYPELNRNVKWINSELRSMLSLAFAIEGVKTKSFYYLWLSFLSRPMSIFSWRTLGVIKQNLYVKRGV